MSEDYKISLKKKATHTQTEIADILGISRRTLHSYLKKMGCTPNGSRLSVGTVMRLLNHIDIPYTFED
ncbi:MAG: winged helix-turn-helix domain-containing protein [Cyclobacteriaceae bacterium]